MSDALTCPHCGCGYTSHLGADTRAGRHCFQCGQYAGFPDANRTTYPVVCERCGQVSVCEIDGASLVCAPCRDRDRAPQGETVRLFEPAPAQMPGQTGLAL